MSRNVLLVCLDSVRKDYFDVYARRLQRLSDFSINQCRAASSWSVPSHASMFTGELPHRHGVHANNFDFSSLSRDSVFTARPEFADHRTFGLSANVWASSAFGFDSLFDEFADVSPHRRLPDGMHVRKFFFEREARGYGGGLELARHIASHDHPLDSAANVAFYLLKHVADRSPVPSPFDDGANVLLRECKRTVGSVDEPFFGFVNFMDAHGPYHNVLGYDRSLNDASNAWTSADLDLWEMNVNGTVREHEADVRRYRGLYGTAIEYLDRRLSSLIEWLDENTARETTVIVTADHGENLGYSADNRLVGHMSDLTEGQLHVPLTVVNAPFDLDTGDRYFSHLRLGQLLAGLVRGERPDLTADTIVAELVGGTPPVMNAPAGERSHWDRMQRVAYRDETKYQWDTEGTRLEYTIDVDRPCWQRPHASAVQIPDWALEHFDGGIDEYKRVASTSTADLDGEVAQRLEELGYLYPSDRE